MSDFDIKEKRFEQDIEEYLITEGDYEKGDPRKFDRKLALDTETFLKFIKISQPKQWERYEKIYGTASEKQVVERFCREVLLRWIKSFYRLKAIMKRRISGMDIAVHGYAQNNDLKTFMLLFEKDFPNMAASRYEQNEEFFVRMFKEPDMMKQIMDMLGTVLFEK